MAVLLSVAFGLLVYAIHVDGVVVCATDGTLEVVENRSRNVFTCTDARRDEKIQWFQEHIFGKFYLVSCSRFSCRNYHSPRFEGRRTGNDRTTLTVDGSNSSYLRDIRGQTIGCKTGTWPFPPVPPYLIKCEVDVVAVPSVTCDARDNIGRNSQSGLPRTVTVNCSVSGAYSYLNRYTCNLTQTTPTTKKLGYGNLTVTSTSGSGGKYKTGYCQVTVPYPDVVGVYSYKMAVTPGRQDVPVSFEGQSSLEISCNGTQFMCPEGTCIPDFWVCDTYRDCDDGADEGICTCTESQYTCPDTRCIPNSYVCDRLPDCSYGADEENCTCDWNEYTCPEGKCILNTKVCDGIGDCDDDYEEWNCTCSDSQFACPEGRCIPYYWVCDNFPDCSDGPDESNCTTCTKVQFRCPDGSCIFDTSVCDGYNDCVDGYEEDNCTCTDSQFMCARSRRCVPNAWVCDHDPDCSDVSDEANCTCLRSQFMCASRDCVSYGLVCNGHDDCSDRSDEANCID